MLPTASAIKHGNRNATLLRAGPANRCSRCDDAAYFGKCGAVGMMTAPRAQGASEDEA
jgi:hypothetical protein